MRQKTSVLLHERPIEAILLVQGLFRRRRNVALRLERAAGRRMHQEERQGGDDPERGNEQQDPPREKGGHGRAFAASVVSAGSGCWRQSGSMETNFNGW